MKDEQFSRTALLLGDAAVEKLAASRVIVFGLGGVGGYAVEALARTGVGHLDLVDNDVISLSAGSEPIDISMLKDKIKEFLTNPADDPNLPEKEIKQIEGYGACPVTKGIISLQNDRGTSYRAYIAVQNELIKAINELRDEFSTQNYGKKFGNLTQEQQKIVKEAVPQSISEAEPKDTGKK